MEKSISAIHDLFDAKKISPSEFLRNQLQTAKSNSSNAFIGLSEERATAQAKKADADLARLGKVPRSEQPLFGVPMAVKDNLALEGVRTTAGSKVLDNYTPPYTATAVARLEAAGAITVGKTNLDEFAMGGSNENSAYGPVKHPNFPDRVAGGSSGGSAAAVTAGLCQFALGSDTGGSIRLPASFCGIVGLKPTYGRVSRYGLIAFASSLDQIGPMTRSVEDAATVLDVMSGYDPMDSTSAFKGNEVGGRKFLEAARTAPDFAKLRIGVPKEYLSGGVQAEVQKSIQEALNWFEKKGAKLVPVSLPNTPYSIAVYYIVAVSEASSNLARFDGVRYGVRPPKAQDLEAIKDLADFYKEVRAGFGAEVKRRIILGTFALSAGYSDAYFKRACQVRRLIKKDFDSAFENVDVIMGPVTPTTAFKLGEQVSDPLTMYLNDLFAIPANLVGLPAISVPCGNDSSKLPIGLHMMSKAFSEEMLLSVANAFERRDG
jgi:aspartyl-tRNA(Asn)/glutamyl-tRNA(Gln) amidotransferase subunit A